MIPYDSQERNNDNNSPNRRGSLFSKKFGSSSTSSPSSSSSPSGVGGFAALISRQNTDAHAPLCPNCKRYEIDLTNTSDSLIATDAELKASRQVISLLQRQLELSRVAKDGLERLIISQPDMTANEKGFGQLAKTTNTDLLTGIIPSSNDQKTSGETNSINQQQALLKLIQTELYARDEEIVKLKFTLKETKNDKEQLLLQVHQLEEDNANHKGEISTLQEKIDQQAKTIEILSHEVLEQGQPSDTDVSRRFSVFETSSYQLSLNKAQRQVAKITDDLEAYTKTNKLLVNTVDSLTTRCADLERKEMDSRSQCQELEAKCCQIQSKLLSLLKEIEQSSKPRKPEEAIKSDEVEDQEVIRSESVKLLIKRLLEDKSLDIPLSWKEENNKREENKHSSSKHECDELGFYFECDDNREKSPRSRSDINKNLARPCLAGTLPVLDELDEIDNRKSDMTRQTSVDGVKGNDITWHNRWDNFIKDFDKTDLKRSREFKSLLRAAVPQEYRCKVWKALVGLHMKEERSKYGPNYYQSLLEPNRPPNSSKKLLNPSSKQIELDLLRTLPNNKHFESLDSSGTIRLRRVLIAYSEHNARVGYCQGMNRLAAVALLVLPEEEAFWCLVAIVDHIMPAGYYNDLWLAQIDSAVVMDYVALKMPQLSEHFRKNSIELSLFAWFLTIFVDGSPPAIFLRLWDCFLYEGDKILFRIALALLKINEVELLELSNSVAVNNFLRSSISAPMNVDHLFHVAFDCMNPLSSKSLSTKRRHHFHIIRAGIDDKLLSTHNMNFSKVSDDENDDSPDDSSIISI